MPLIDTRCRRQRRLGHTGLGAKLGDLLSNVGSKSPTTALEISDANRAFRLSHVPQSTSRGSTATYLVRDEASGPRVTPGPPYSPLRREFLDPETSNAVDRHPRATPRPENLSQRHSRLGTRGAVGESARTPARRGATGQYPAMRSRRSTRPSWV